jgi:hypothetical protein
MCTHFLTLFCGDKTFNIVTLRRVSKVCCSSRGTKTAAPNISMCSLHKGHIINLLPLCQYVSCSKLPNRFRLNVVWATTLKVVSLCSCELNILTSTLRWDQTELHRFFFLKQVSPHRKLTMTKIYIQFLVFWVDAPHSVVGNSTLKMNAARCSETLVSNHHTTRSNPENHEFCLHRRENLKCRTNMDIF